jgi:hypothetical protein
LKAEREQASALFGRGDADSSARDSVAKMTARIAGNFDETTQGQFRRRTERVFEDELSYAIVFHLKDKSETEMRQLADSFAFDSCSPNADLVEVYFVGNDRQGVTNR